MDEEDHKRIEKNVAGGFHGLLEQITRGSTPPRPDIEGKTQAAWETWKAGHHNLTISLLLDAMIILRQERELAR